MEWLQDLGYLGLFIGSFLASTVIPMSADVLLLGLLAMGGNPIICLVVATVGNWAGGMTSYGIGWMGKWEWIEKWFKVTPSKLERQKETIMKYDTALALLTWLPFIGDVFAIGLGFYKIKPKTCALYMLLGRFARFVVWIILYEWLAEDFVRFVQGAA